MGFGRTKGVRRRRPTARTGWLTAGLATVAVLVAAAYAHRAASPPRVPAAAPGRAAPAAVPAAAHPPNFVPAAAHPPDPLRVADLGPLLPEPLSGLSATTMGATVYLLGGDGPAGFSAAAYAFTPGGGGTLSEEARLPQALHDGAAVAAGGSVWFCGGGTAVGQNAIYRFTPGGGVAEAGHLGLPLSDLGGAVAGGVPLCLGGWTGSVYSDAVFDPAVSAPDGSAALVGHLAHAVRYGAFAPLAGGVLVAGGRRDTGVPIAALQWLPPPRPRGIPVTARVVGALPGPLAYAMGAALDHEALVIGGQGGAGRASATIWAVPAPGARPRAVGRLPVALYDGAAASVGHTVYVFGGEVAGQASDHVWAISAG